MKAATKAAMLEKAPAPKEYQEQLLDLLPAQGSWTEEEYLHLTDSTNRLVEYSDGYLEFLPLPTDDHPTFLENLFLLFIAYIKPRGGVVHFAALRLRIRSGKIRESDILLLKSKDDPRRENRLWHGADLVVEIVSPDAKSQQRDLQVKRREYATGKIPEYWIVNPKLKTITVLALGKRMYRTHGIFKWGADATSVILPGFSANVAEVFTL